MTNRKRFFLNGLLLTLVGLAVRGVSLVLNAYVARTVGEEGIGLFTLIGTVYSFAITFATAGISLTVTRLVSSAIGEGRVGAVSQILRSSILYSLIFSIAASLVLFFGAPLLSSIVLNDVRCTDSLRILSASLVPLTLSSVFSGYFVGVKRVGKNAATQVCAQIFKIAITVLLLSFFFDSGSLRGIAALCLSITLTEISVFAISLLLFILDKRRYIMKKSKREGHFTAVSKMAMPLAFSAYVRSFLLTIEHILIPKRLRDRGESHSEALASYGVLHAMALPTLLYPMAPLSSFAGLLVPEFSESLARGEKKRLSRIASEALNVTLVYAVGVATLIFTFSEELGYVLYSSHGAGRFMAIMAPVIPIMYLDHVTDAMLKGIGEHVYSMWVNITDAILSIVLVWLLIPKMGIMGYAVVIVAMEGYNFLLSAVRLNKRIRFKIEPVSSVVFPLAAGLISGFVSSKIFTRAGVNTSGIWLFLEILFAAICFFGVRFLLSELFFAIKHTALQKKKKGIE